MTNTKEFPKMEYVRLGNTGMKVSRFGLGCMSYGNPAWADWVKGEEESLDIIKKAYDAGINFFDTADCYSNGESERILGKAIKKFNMPRSRIVVATKVFYATPNDTTTVFASSDKANDPDFVNTYGLSRKHIFDAVDASLKRLDLDYIDLYQIHRFDHGTPIEETMEALNDLIRSGKVRYIGASSMLAFQFQKANNIAEKNGWAKFCSMQNLYNLIYREEEREMIPYCVDQGIASIHWSPLARGMLSSRNHSTIRTKSDAGIDLFFTLKQNENDKEIVNRVCEIADKHGISPTQVALAWMLGKPHVTAPLVGISKVDHLYEMISSLAVKLSDQEVNYLEELYIPHKLIPM